MRDNRVRRVLWAVLGWLLFGVGWAGVFVPGLPTTIFWILAALIFIRVNPRMYARIIRHPRFGSSVRLFVEQGRISRRGKWISIVAMLVFAGAGSAVIPPLWVKLVVMGAAIAGSVWVALLPTPERGDQPGAEPLSPGRDSSPRSPSGPPG